MTNVFKHVRGVVIEANATNNSFSERQSGRDNVSVRLSSQTGPRLSLDFPQVLCVIIIPRDSLISSSERLGFSLLIYIIRPEFKVTLGQRLARCSN